MDKNEVRPLVGVLSLQAVNNYGSLLQALATQWLFERDGMFEVVFYDYYPEDTRFLGLLKIWTNMNPGKIIAIMPTIIRWNVIFKAYRKKLIHFTKTKYFTIKDFKNKPITCEAICIGSDQVWNSVWNKGIIPELYLEYAQEEKYTFSFASSFGVTSVSEDEVAVTKPWLKRFNRLSVREKSANEILKNQYDIYDGEVLLDPTLLVPPERWRELEFKKEKWPRYILIYNLFRRKEFEEYAKKISEKTGLKLVRLCFRYDQMIRIGKSVLMPSVPKFLALIDNAEFILTDSFHGTAFSISFNRYPICYLPPNFSTRIIDFLQRIGAENRIVKDCNDFSVLDKNLDFDDINRKLQKEREKCNRFLKSVYYEIVNENNK